jgi:putative ABC transport system permease protein
VARLFLLESALLGALGGVIGTVLGGLLFFSFYGSLPTFVAGIALVGIAVPSVVGVLAAIYPARAGARVPPAEVMRYE